MDNAILTPSQAGISPFAATLEQARPAVSDLHLEKVTWWATWTREGVRPAWVTEVTG